MKTYITFKEGQTHNIGQAAFNHKTVAVINSKSIGEGRRLAYQYFGRKFDAMHSEGSFYYDFEHCIDECFPGGLIEANKA